MNKSPIITNKNVKTYLDINEILYLLSKGISNNKIFIYLKNEYIFIKQSDTRCFTVSMRRLRNSLNIKYDNEIYNIIIKNINTISVEKENHNYFLIINIPSNLNIMRNFNYKIKIKEIYDFLDLYQTDSKDIIIKKQHEKIFNLLEKIKYYENKYKEPTTDEEMFILY